MGLSTGQLSEVPRTPRVIPPSPSQYPHGWPGAVSAVPISQVTEKHRAHHGPQPPLLSWARRGLTYSQTPHFLGVGSGCPAKEPPRQPELQRLQAAGPWHGPEPGPGAGGFSSAPPGTGAPCSHTSSVSLGRSASCRAVTACPRVRVCPAPNTGPPRPRAGPFGPWSLLGAVSPGGAGLEKSSWKQQLTRPCVEETGAQKEGVTCFTGTWPPQGQHWVSSLLARAPPRSGRQCFVSDVLTK